MATDQLRSIDFGNVWSALAVQHPVNVLLAFLQPSFFRPDFLDLTVLRLQFR